MSHSGLPAALVEEAAHWLVRLDAGECSREAFDAWQNTAPEHARAVQSLQDMLGQFDNVAPGPARAALGAAQRRKRSGIGSALALAATLLVPGYLFLQHAPPAYLLADIRTGTRQWQERRLDDGSLIRLNGRSAVDLHFDARQRLLQLIQGEILVEVARDSSRPFIVETAHGQIRALGTRFIVQQDDNATRLLMLESKTAVSAKGSSLEIQAEAGQQVRIDTSGVSAIMPLDTRGLEQAWQQHQLITQDRPLLEVLDELARHHRGYLLFDRNALADQRISAVLPLDDSAKALRLLAQSMGLQVEQYSPWITVVKRQD
jgi:transmembrane sensor